MEKYILYARKSTESEDKQCESIGDQLAEMRKVAKAKGVKIVKEFSEAKSAHIPGKRQEFEKMMALIKTGEYSGILAWDQSRLTRNPEDAGRIEQALRDSIKRIIFHDRECTQKDHLIMSVTSVMDTEYSDKLKAAVERGARRKAAERHMPPYAIPPLGYKTEIVEDLTKKGGHGKIIVPDPLDFYKVRQLWEKALSGVSSIPMLMNYANNVLALRTPKHGRRGGTPLTRNGVDFLLKNPFYYGVFKWNGELYNGEYRPMVTKDEWDSVQQILAGGNGHATRPKNKAYDFLFRNVFKCGVCGYAIVSELRQKKYNVVLGPA